MLEKWISLPSMGAATEQQRQQQSRRWNRLANGSQPSGVDLPRNPQTISPSQSNCSYRPSLWSAFDSGKRSCGLWQERRITRSLSVRPETGDTSTGRSFRFCPSSDRQIEQTAEQSDTLRSERFRMASTSLAGQPRIASLPSFVRQNCGCVDQSLCTALFDYVLFFLFWM